jgi:CBS domain-containing protein
MGAMLAGTMRSPLTGVIFSFELTGDYHSILPLLIACVAAHAFTVLTLARSILTEKISRRGHHLSREYVVDPMEALAVEDAMETEITAFPADATLAELQQTVSRNDSSPAQRVYPVVDAQQHMVGVVTRGDLRGFSANLTAGEATRLRLADVLSRKPVVAYPDEPLRLVVNRMALTGLTRFPVIGAGAEPQVLGLISLEDLIKAREFNLNEEHRRERVLRLRLPPSLRRRWATNGEHAEEANVTQE